MPVDRRRCFAEAMQMRRWCFHAGGRKWLIQIRPNRYLVARSDTDPTRTACLDSTPDDWVTVRAPEPGRYTLQGALSVRGVLAEVSPSCSS